MADERWAALVRVARKQWGVVSAEQVFAEGLGAAGVRWRTQCGDLERVMRGVYRLPGAQRCCAGDALAALFSVGPDSALSHQSAAWAWRLTGDAPPSITIHISTPWELHSRGAPRLCVHRTRVPFKIVQLGPLRVTTVARTLVDLAGVAASDAFLEDALDTAQRLHPSTEAQLRRALTRLGKGTPGLAVLRRLLDARTGQFTDSRLESRVGRGVRAAGLPPPQYQFVVFDEHGYVLRIDFAWPEYKVALHVDSYLWHHQRSRFERDRAAFNRLAALGWQSLFVTSRSFDDGTWLGPLRAALAQREPQLSMW